MLGLNDYAYFVTPRRGTSGPQTYVTAPPTGANVPNTSLLSPKTLWSIYGLPSTNLGNGQSMAIFGWGVNTGVIPDLRSFEQDPPAPPTIGPPTCSTSSRR